MAIIILIEWLRYETNLKKLILITYFYKGSIAPIKFIGFKGPLHIFKSIYNGCISLEDVEKQ